MIKKSFLLKEAFSKMSASYTKIWVYIDFLKMALFIHRISYRSESLSSQVMVSNFRSCSSDECEIAVIIVISSLVVGGLLIWLIVYCSKKCKKSKNGKAKWIQTYEYGPSIRLMQLLFGEKTVFHNGKKILQKLNKQNK